jgi:hypothetical protein
MDRCFASAVGFHLHLHLHLSIVLAVEQAMTRISHASSGDSAQSPKNGSGVEIGHFAMQGSSAGSKNESELHHHQGQRDVCRSVLLLGVDVPRRWFVLVRQIMSLLFWFP